MILNCFTHVGLPGVVFILPDSYIDPVNKEYGGKIAPPIAKAIMDLLLCSTAVNSCTICFERLYNLWQ